MTGVLIVAFLAVSGPVAADPAGRGTPAVDPSAVAAAAPRPAGLALDTTSDCDSVTTCYTPGQIAVAYGFWPLLYHGIDGSGETVVLPELAEQQTVPPTVTDIRQDLAGFDQQFGLPAPRLRVITEFARGASPSLAYIEEALDVEMVHAIAPAAAIIVVLEPYSSMQSATGLTAALIDTLRLGTSSGDVISMSEGVGESCFTRAQVARLHAALRAAARRHVTVVASSGDTGPIATKVRVKERR